MMEQTATSPNVKVTRAALTLLQQLRQHYQRDLKFRIFADDTNRMAIRVHDKDYLGDWILDLSDAGLAVAKPALSHAHLFAVDCRKSTSNRSGFELLLNVDHLPSSVLNGDQVIERIMSEETEICDVYGEYCYSTYEGHWL